MDQAANQHAGVWAIVGGVMWLTYGSLSGAGHWLAAGIVSFAIAMVIVAAQYRRASVKIMDCTSVGYFVLEIAIVLIAGNHLLQHFHLLFVWGGFAIVAWATIVIGAPFTLQYSREQAPREIWASPTFYRMNLHLSVAWAFVFTISAILGALSMVIGYALLLGLVLPLAGMAFGFIFSNRYPKRFLAQFETESRLQGEATPTHEITETIPNAARP
jgi:all-trans-retinol 13,14-reductase